MKQLFKYIAVFILFFTVFLGWHSLINDFLGTDPYYHSKHSYLMLENKDFTLVEAWSKFHFLENAPVDLWWAYHLAQAGLIYFFSIIWGTKVLTAISASFVFTFFYFVLNKFKISRPFVWTTLLLFSSVSFTSRMLLERPLIGSVALALLGYYFIAKKKYVSLFILTIFFALYHQMCLMILIPLFFYYLAEFYIDKQIDLKLAVASLGGLLFGIILHPNALNYINTLYITYWQIFYLKFSGVNLSIGSELQTFFLSHLIDDNLVLFIFFIFTLALFFKELLEKKIKDKILLSLFLISLFWFLVSILIIRGVEYWAPFGLLFIAVAFDRIKKTNDYEIAGKFIKDRIKPRIVLFFISAVVILFLINNALNIFFMINGVNKNNKNIYFKEANDWLISNTEKAKLFFTRFGQCSRGCFFIIIIIII